ncbi:MAG: kinD [Burkholderiales bacterium]|nr:kinD [Burkholderiales bacterium]
MYKKKSIADGIQDVLDKVIQTGERLQTEDKIIDVRTGKIRYFSATRAPLRNKKNEIIGILGTSIEITAQKEADRLKHENTKLEAENKMKQMLLKKEAAEKKTVEKEAERLKLENEVHKLENEKHQAAAEEQEKFRKFVGQIVHDIQSPLSSLRRLVDATSSILPEEERITLRQASMRIGDIAYNMLGRYKNQAEDEIAEPLLVSATMHASLSEKRYEYNKINFNTNFSPDADFAFIKVEPSQFKQMISNLLNNAVEAIEGKPDGRIDLGLDTSAEWVMIDITDNGKGMSEELVQKIENGIAVTEGKKNGSGIGLAQIRDTIKRNFGELKIFSTVGSRTRMLIQFPKIMAPFWIAEEIKIIKGDTIIILDDDPSIHGAWDSKLAATLAKIPQLKIKHFSVGLEAVNLLILCLLKKKVRYVY